MDVLDLDLDSSRLSRPPTLLLSLTYWNSSQRVMLNVLMGQKWPARPGIAAHDLKSLCYAMLSKWDLITTAFLNN